MTMEKPIRFGERNGLVGIITEPAGSNHELPAVILINAGLIHRVGPYRLYVDLARELSADGFISFRLDLSGVGDSAATSDTRKYEERVIEEVRQAMDWLETHNKAKRFILAGLCSGAFNAHHTANADKRVCGIIWLDGFGYKTGPYYFRQITKHYARRVISPQKWMVLLKRLGWRFFSTRSADMDTAGMNVLPYYEGFPAREKIVSELRDQINRGMRFLIIYSGGVTEYYNDPRQFKEMFPELDFNGRLRLEHFMDSDHMYTVWEDRIKVSNAIRDWISGTFACRQSAKS
jgi:hypothetical protein